MATRGENGEVTVLIANVHLAIGHEWTAPNVGFQVMPLAIGLQAIRSSSQTGRVSLRQRESG